MSTFTRIPAWVQQTQKFQDYALINKAVLEAVGDDLPRITFARNSNERKEILFRQGIVLLAAFAFAPLHAFWFSKLFSHLHQVDQRLMRLSFNDLKSVPALERGLEALSLTIKNTNPKRNLTRPIVTEALRGKLIRGKCELLLVDLMLEGLIFANLGWIKNWFGRHVTGRKQFTGEMGAVPQQKLDALYADQQKSKKRSVERLLPVLTSGLAIMTPVVLSLVLRKAMLNIASPSGMTKKLQNVAHLFDYKQGFVLSLSSLFVIGLLDAIGDIAAARSSNECRETVIKKIPDTLTFFYGDKLWMALISRLFLKRRGLQALEPVQQVLKKNPLALQAKAAKTSAILYWVSFLLNTLTMSGIILFNNIWTIKSVKAAVAHLKSKGATQTQSAQLWHDDKPDSPLEIHKHYYHDLFGKISPDRQGRILKVDGSPSFSDRGAFSQTAHPA